MESHLQQVKNSESQTFSEKQKEALQSSPSPSSSPSHDFSFTISLQPPSSSSNSKLISPTKTTSSYQQTVDLSPADDIFFHGHLLPLHLLSHLPVSPRTSTASNLNDGSSSTASNINDGSSSTASNINDGFSSTATTLPATTTEEAKNNTDGEINRVKTKPVKSFSLFGLPKWRKGLEGNERESEQQQQQQKKKVMSLDLSHAVKKYIRMMFQRRGNGTQFMNRRQTNSSYSFSSSSLMGSSSKGNSKTMINNGSSSYKDLIMRGRRPPGDLFSAPASMRTSPTNSGHLRVSTAGLITSSSSSSSSDSTMEELQAAIQAAIAHCKNSSAVDR